MIASTVTSIYAKSFSPSILATCVVLIQLRRFKTNELHQRQLGRSKVILTGFTCMYNLGDGTVKLNRIEFFI